MIFLTTFRLLDSSTPQQNGVVEKKNLTLHEFAISMLNEYDLPKYFFWTESVNTAFK